MSLAIVTPSYAPDFSRFRRLHESVLTHAPAGVIHHVLVPPPDVRLFSSIQSSGLRVLRQPDVLPKQFVTTTRLSRIPRLPRGYRVGAVNLRRPWPPIRGWVLQQMVKMAFVSTLDVDVALLIDSDVMLVRPFNEEMFRSEGTVRHYRLPHAVHPDMARHMNWRDTATKLLGLGAPSDDHADYISGMVSWSPAIVRDVQARIEAVASLPWATVVGSELDVSEYFLYGEYLAALGTPTQKAFTSTQSLCHSSWGGVTQAAADEFVDLMSATDIAIHVQSNSDTSASVLNYILAKVRGS